jgi:uncharacterized protein (DUF2225 family)
MADITQLARLGVLKKYGAREVLFKQGDPGSEMFIILRGKVAVLLDSNNSPPFAIAELGPGDFFGEMSLLEGMPRSATIRALEDTIVITIDDNNFEAVIAQQPQIAYRIMKGLSSRLRRQNEELSWLRTEKGETEVPHAVEETRSEGIIQPADPSLFPPGHKTYLMNAASNDNLLFDREITCPICEQTFKEKAVRSSKLRLDSVDPDSRQRFVGFEPLWYLVWVCPHCYYANFNSEFKQLPGLDKKGLREQGKNLKSKVAWECNCPRGINDVFVAYYLMLQTLEVGKAEPGKKAKVWLRLAWLYDDVDDKPMMEYASKQAFGLFKESYYNQNRDTSIEQDQRVSLVLGELGLKIGEDREAAEFFRRAINRRGGNVGLNRQAEDRIQDLKGKIQLEM